MRKKLALVAVALAVLLAAAPVALGSTLAARYRGKRIVGVATKKKVIAFDFDDGPINSQQIIDIMAREGGKPTFFWVGSRITAEAAEYAVAHHAEIASHGMWHVNFPALSPDRELGQVVDADNLIASLTGRRPTWFRAPFNTVGPELINQVIAEGLLYAHYYLMTRDYDVQHVSAEALVRIFDKPQPGAIYVFHEGMANTIAALPIIMRNLHSKGYHVVTNSELLRYGPAVETLPPPPPSRIGPQPAAVTR